MTRAGFMLAEVAVSLVLLSLAALLFAAAAGAAAGSTRSSALREGAVARAERLVDSLLAGPWTGGGVLADGPYLARWSGPAGAGAEVVVTYRDGGSDRRVAVRLAAASLPRADTLARPWP